MIIKNFVIPFLNFLSKIKFIDMLFSCWVNVKDLGIVVVAHMLWLL